MSENPTVPDAAARQGTYPGTARAMLRIEGGDVVVENMDGGGELIRVGSGGVIQWDSDAPIKWWAIVMKNETPFDGDDGWAGSNRGKQRVTRIRRGANGSGTRRYAYAIVASDGQQVFYRDPEVEVGPDEPNP